MANIQFTPYLINKQESNRFPETKVPDIIARSKNKPLMVSQLTQSETTEDAKPITRGITTYKSKINIGNMQSVIDKFNDYGISIRVTSGLRPGAVTSSGKQSFHSTGDAIDITPGEGETWDTLKTKLKSNPELVEWMQSQGYGILDETDPHTMARTNATGAHWHIGKDKNAVNGLLKLLAKKGTVLKAKEGVVLIEPTPTFYTKQFALQTNPFNYVLDPQEAAFQEWYAKEAELNGWDPNPDDKEHYYDFRGYFNDNGDEIIAGHFPDTYKLPGHPMFSIESKYYDPNTQTAGHWVGENFVMPKDDYDKIANDRYWMALSALRRNGYDNAEQLAKFLAAQSIAETGWTSNVSDNNYAGYKKGGKKMKFNSIDEFWDNHLRNLSSKWKDWTNAKSIQEYFDIINNTALGLDTKEKYDAYIKTHPDVYIYAPAWENEDYMPRLESVFKRTNKYLN